MSSLHYYNEIEPYCAAWLRNLMDAGHIPAGFIDTRSIEDVRPDELAGYVQCHFFAGIGGWPLALALAGWPVDRPVWTGSCPCQPFSAAGKGAGFADQRHLWPAWQHLIAQCRPAVLFGEQVASKDADPWVDLVHADLEGMGHAFGCVPFPSAGIGAPHIRDRAYWVADTCRQGLSEQWRQRNEPARPAAHGVSDGLADTCGAGLPQRIGDGRVQREALGAPARQAADGDGATGWLGDADRAAGERGTGGISGAQTPIDRARIDHGCEHHGPADAGEGLGTRPGPTNGFWRAADWLGCTDGKWRPVEPGTFPLAHGIPNRVGRLRAYGNAIVPQAAAAFITAYAEARGIGMESVKESQAC